MTLDIVTLHVVSVVVVSIVTAVFVLEVASRGRSPVDHIWTLAFGLAISTALCYFAAAWSPTLWWFVALGNASSVATTFVMWNGIRADDGRRPLLGVTAAAAVLTTGAALLPGPDGGEWAGGWALLLGTGAGAGLGSAAGLRGRLRRHRLGVLLSGVLAVVAGYYLVRAAVFVAAGPESPVFTRLLGTAPTTILVLTLVLVAGHAMVGIRADEARAREGERLGFDPTTGLRTAAGFEPRAREVLAAAEPAAEPVALVAVALEGTEHLRTAFDRDSFHEAVALVSDTAHLLAPPGSLAVRPRPDVIAFLLPGYAGTQAHAWAESLRRRVIATPLTVDGVRMRVRVSIGVAGDAECGYHLDALRAAAERRVGQALAEGGNRVVGWL